MNRYRHPQRNRSQGFGMIEVLVTVVILSIGLLGLTGLQLTSLRANKTAEFRTQVTWLAYDMSDRMRANVEGVDAGSYDNADPVQIDTCLTLVGCSVAEMAQHDTFEWVTSIQNSLPDGDGVVCLDSTPNDGVPGAPQCDGVGNVYAIKVWWDDDRDGVQDRFEVSFQP